MTARFGLSKKQRLRHQNEIHPIFARGTLTRLGPLNAKWLATESDESRFLISIKKRVGSAPVRNRTRRLIREAIRLHQHRLASSYDISFFVTRPPQFPLQYSYVERQVQRLFRQLNSPQSGTQ